MVSAFFNSTLISSPMLSVFSNFPLVGHMSSPHLRGLDFLNAKKDPCPSHVKYGDYKNFLSLFISLFLFYLIGGESELRMAIENS